MPGNLNVLTYVRLGGSFWPVNFPWRMMLYNPLQVTHSKISIRDPSFQLPQASKKTHGSRWNSWQRFVNRTAELRTHLEKSRTYWIIRLSSSVIIHAAVYVRRFYHTLSKPKLSPKNRFRNITLLQPESFQTGDQKDGFFHILRARDDSGIRISVSSASSRFNRISQEIPTNGPSDPVLITPFLQLFQVSLANKFWRFVSKKTQEKTKHKEIQQLVGGWTNPSEKYGAGVVKLDHGVKFPAPKVLSLDLFIA